ncbi:VWA domain-containing protein [Sporosarcina luteola]|uniref:VWA domain-containing protein n=1 Tax=Sporosarcina luteola TaxID=582850 RepID=UPI002040092C|nr:VWA domain-containing protein [Sporosarcina luteola]MCM3638182.1 VWA domain-containing protein [Sporosarcina luteola]
MTISIESRSVLNTDAFDKRRFNEIYSMSQGIQKVRDEGELPTFEPLLADIWASLYKMKPEITKEEVSGDLKVNKSLMERIMMDDSFENYRNFTRLDDLSSAIGTMKFGEKTNQWLADQKMQDSELRKKLQEIQAMQRQLEKQEQQEGHGNVNEQLQSDLSQAMDGLDGHIQQTLQNSSHSFSEQMSQAVQETRQVKANLKSLMGGVVSGSGEAELKKVPLRDQISLAEKIASDKRLLEIAEWAGRFKQIAIKKQKSKHNEGIESKGVIAGDVIERLLPIELGLYKHPTTKIDFLRRFSKRQTMMFEQNGKDALGKGPIVLCLDQSGSMRKRDSQSKGFALALLSIAKKQKRDFCLVLFSTRTVVKVYEKGKIKTEDLIELAQTFLSGGTDFNIPLTKAVSIIEDSKFKRSDLIFITDGEDSLKDSFIKSFIRKKENMDFNVLSLVLGNNTETVQHFSDEVILITDLNDEGSFKAFTI